MIMRKTKLLKRANGSDASQALIRAGKTLILPSSTPKQSCYVQFFQNWLTK
jgi:hypothetical protein